MVQVTGQVRLIGNEPFTELVIRGDEREWHITPEDEHKLRDLQHRTVTVQGTEAVTILRFANGFPAGERYTLGNISIISVD